MGKQVLFVFNGRNAGNIAAEARAQYPEHDLYVIREETDTLPAPEGLPVVTVGDLPRMTWRRRRLIIAATGQEVLLLPDGTQVDDAAPESIVLVANGGRTAAQVRTLLTLLGTGADPAAAGRYVGRLRLVDLQPEGETVLLDRPALGLSDRLMREEFTPEHLEYFGVIREAADMASSLPADWTLHFQR